MRHRLVVAALLGLVLAARAATVRANRDVLQRAGEAVDIVVGAIPMTRRTPGVSAVVCAIAQICALAMPASAASPRTRRPAAHAASRKATGARTRTPARTARRRHAGTPARRQRTDRPPATTAGNGQRAAGATRLSNAFALNAFVAAGLTLCAYPPSPFSFAALRTQAATTPRQPEPPMVPVQPAVDTVMPADAPVVPVATDLETISTTAPLDSATQPDPLPGIDAPPAAAPDSTELENRVEPDTRMEPDTQVADPVVVADPQPEVPLTAEAELAPPGADSVRFIGLVEASAGDLRVAVIGIGARVFYGRKGDIVGGRYRVLGFTEDAALVFDLAASTTRTLAIGLR